MDVMVYQDLDSGAWVVESGSLVKHYDVKYEAYREASLLENGLVDTSLPYFTDESDLDKISSLAYQYALKGLVGRPFDLESDLQICAWNIGYRLGVNSRK